MDEYNIREKHIKLTTLKMEYTILKTSKQEHQEKIYTFVSHNMKMDSVEQSKIALSWKDDKRIPMSHNKHLTYALGHYKTK